MALSLNETFRVAADPDRVWRFLKSPADVVTCLPGAELTDVIDERTYAGKVKVKVGPITAAYAGKATLTQVDDSARRMQIVAEGKESGGPGSARMTMTGHVSALAEGGAEVSVDAQIDVAGRVMQFGRNLFESVNKQLFKQFADAVQSRLAAAEAAGTVPLAADPSPAPAASSDASAGATPGIGEGAAPPAPSGASEPTPAAPSAGREGGGSMRVGSDGIVFTSEFTGGASPAPARGQELSAISLVWRLLTDWLRRLFGGKR